MMTEVQQASETPGAALQAAATEATSTMRVLLIARHHANIAKLARGEESRIGEKGGKPGESAI